MTIVQEFIDRAKGKVNPSHLTRSTVISRLTEANGFKDLGNVGDSMILVNPSFDPDNVVDPTSSEWLIQWHSWTGKFLQAPALFFVWWNDPTDLKYLIEEGHIEAHLEEMKRQRQEEDAAFFAGLEATRKESS